MPFRAKCMNNLKQQLGISNMQQQILPIATSKDKAADENILAMLDYTEENEMFPDGDENLGLQNFLSNVKAEPEQAKDLLEFQPLRQKEFEKYVSYQILGTPSTNAPSQRKTRAEGKGLNERE